MNQSDRYDVVIVGAGIAGGLIAYELGKANKKVLILEAGQKIPPNVANFMEQFYLSSFKTPESPYPPAMEANPGLENAPRPTILSLIFGWQEPSKSYLIQKGPLPFKSTYERIGGGTTRHWLGTCLRLLPNDFKLRSLYGQGVDWPITYEDLNPWYNKAEHEIGVAADKEDQSYLGLTFDLDYRYPMPEIPPTILDRTMSQSLAGINVDGQPIIVTSTPQARNSIPYDSRPVCGGNTNCIPICPIGAKYDASVTLNKAFNTGNVHIVYQTVATEILVNSETGLVSGIRYIKYEDEKELTQKTEGIVTGSIYVLAAHAIETSKLLLNSHKQIPTGIANSSDLVGRNLMDHPIYLAWALMPDPVYPYRGPLSTSGIENLRDGTFRRDRAVFRIEIGNDGWSFPIGDPNRTIEDFIDGTNNSGLNQEGLKLFGKELIRNLNQNLIRQVRLAFLVEQSPEPTNRIVPSRTVFDNLGIPRPEIEYSLSEYTQNGFVAARQTANAIFDRLGAIEFTSNNPNNFTYFIAPDGREYLHFGAGHVMGTFRMGTSPSNSVVDKYQRSWDCQNLFLVGSGVFPSAGTANPTLTIAALSLWAAKTIIEDLENC